MNDDDVERTLQETGFFGKEPNQIRRLGRFGRIWHSTRPLDPLYCSYPPDAGTLVPAD
jgi:hypothetical protein